MLKHIIISSIPFLCQRLANRVEDIIPAQRTNSLIHSVLSSSVSRQFIKYSLLTIYYRAVFSGNAHRELATSVAQRLDRGLGKSRIGRFADGEISVKIEESVRGKDVYVIQPTSPPVNENLMELLLVVSTLRQANAKRVTVIVPYFGYMRTDLKVRKFHAKHGKAPLLMRSSYAPTLETESLPVSEKFNSGVSRGRSFSIDQGFEDVLIPTFAASDVATMLEVVGAQRVVVVDLQTSGAGLAEGFFRKAQVESIRTSDVVAEMVYDELGLSKELETKGDERKELVIVAPHSACVPQAKNFRDKIQGILGRNVGLATLISTPSMRLKWLHLFLIISL